MVVNWSATFSLRIIDYFSDVFLKYETSFQIIFRSINLSIYRNKFSFLRTVFDETSPAFYDCGWLHHQVFPFSQLYSTIQTFTFTRRFVKRHFTFTNVYVALTVCIPAWTSVCFAFSFAFTAAETVNAVLRTMAKLLAEVLSAWTVFVAHYTVARHVAVMICLLFYSFLRCSYLRKP